LAYNHYVDCAKKFDQIPESGFHFGSSKDLLEQKMINGYDGFGGVHDNLVWNVTAGLIYYTLNNKLIFENTKTREQTIIADSQVQLSCIAVSSDFKLIATGEGCPS